MNQVLFINICLSSFYASYNLFYITHTRKQSRRRIFYDCNNGKNESECLVKMLNFLYHLVDISIKVFDYHIIYMNYVLQFYTTKLLRKTINYAFIVIKIIISVLTVGQIFGK